MFARLISSLAGLVHRLRPGSAGEISSAANKLEDPLEGIDFRPVGPGELGPDEQGFLCPVTRQPLKSGDRIYRCRACQTSFSETGWEFLRRTNRGKCCACGLRKTVFLR